jgi:hypothetical protein
MIHAVAPSMITVFSCLYVNAEDDHTTGIPGVVQLRVRRHVEWNAWPPFAVFPWLWCRNQRTNNTPLLVSELHGPLDHAADRAAPFLSDFPKTDRTSTTSRSGFRDAF